MKNLVLVGFNDELEKIANPLGKIVGSAFKALGSGLKGTGKAGMWAAKNPTKAISTGFTGYMGYDTIGSGIKKATSVKPVARIPYT